MHILITEESSIKEDIYDKVFDIDSKRNKSILKLCDPVNKIIEDYFLWEKDYSKHNKIIKEFRKEIMTDSFDVFHLLVYWLFIDCDIYFNPLMHQLQLFSAVNNVTEKYKINKISYFGYNKENHRTIKNICTEKNIHFIYKNKDIKPLNNIKKKENIYYVKLMCLGIRKLYSAIYKKNPNNYDIVTVNNIKIRKIINSKLMNISLPEEIRKRTNASIAYIDYHGIQSTKISYMKKIKKEENAFFFEDFLSLKRIIKSFRTQKKIIEIWEKYKQKEEFKNAFKINKINFFYMIEENIDFFFKKYLLIVLFDLNAYDNMIKKIKPKLGYSSAFRAPNELRFFHALMKNEINILRLPHQAIYYDLYLDFSFKGISRARYQNQKNRYKSTTWNNSYKKYLQKNLQIKDVTVTGNMNYDFCYHIDKVKAKESLCKYFNLDKNKKIISIGTSSMLLNTQLIDYLESILSILNRINNITQIIIKQHPRETCNELHKKVTKKYNNLHCIITKDYPITDIISSSEIWISLPSSSNIEALALDIPTIVYDSTKIFTKRDYEFIPYTRDKDHLKKIIADYKNIKKDYPRAIKKHIYKSDGKALDRTIKVFQDILHSAK
jgi:hypothetical protein